MNLYKDKSELYTAYGEDYGVRGLVHRGGGWYNKQTQFSGVYSVAVKAYSKQCSLILPEGYLL